MSKPCRFPRPRLLRPGLGMAAVLAAGLGGAVLAASPAQAYWRGGVWIGVSPAVPYYPPPVYAPPPVVYAPPPPVYAPPPPPAYAPPPVTYAPPPVTYAPQTAQGYGSMCYAGNYTCPLSQQFPVGSGCTCPGIGAPSYGTVH